MARVGAIEAVWANADSPMAQMVVKVSEAGNDEPMFFVFDHHSDSYLIVGSTVRTTVDMQSLLTRDTWEREFGALGTFDQLKQIIDEAYKETA